MPLWFIAAILIMKKELREAGRSTHCFQQSLLEDKECALWKIFNFCRELRVNIRKNHNLSKVALLRYQFLLFNLIWMVLPVWDKGRESSFKLEVRRRNHQREK